MRSVSFAGQGVCSIVETPTPVPAPGEVLVRTVVSALCGSELGTYRRAGMAAGNMGHEGMGIVAAVGTGVTTVKPGDRVGVSAIAGCGEPSCAACTAGQSTWCPRFRFYGSMHAEYFIAGATGCLPLPDEVPDDVGVLLTGDGLGVPYHTSRKLTDPDIERVAIFGLGPVGLGNVLVQSRLGREVLAVDLVPERLDLARKLGAAHVIDGREGDPLPRILELTGGRGADAAIEAAGIPLTARQCFKAVRTAGTVVFNGEQPAVELSPSEDFIRRDVRAIGSWFFHVGEFPDMLRWWRNGLPVADLVTHTFPLAQAPQAFAAFAGGRTGKVLLRYA